MWDMHMHKHTPTSMHMYVLELVCPLTVNSPGGIYFKEITGNILLCLVKHT